MARILGKLQGIDGYVMGDFNVESGTDGPTSDFLDGFTSVGFDPLVSLPTRLTDISEDRPATATLIDNIWINNVRMKMESGLVTVRTISLSSRLLEERGRRRIGEGRTARGG